MLRVGCPCPCHHLHLLDAGWSSRGKLRSRYSTKVGGPCEYLQTSGSSYLIDAVEDIAKERGVPIGEVWKNFRLGDGKNVFNLHLTPDYTWRFFLGPTNRHANPPRSRVKLTADLLKSIYVYLYII